MKIKGLVIMMLFTSLHLQAKINLTFQPEHPQPGQIIQFRYHASDIPDITAIAYLLSGNDLPVAHEITLHQQGNEYTGSIATNDSTTAVFVLLANGDNYYTLMYGGDGKPVQGAALAAAKAFDDYSYYVGLMANSDTAEKYFRQEFSEYPSGKQKFRVEYVGQLRNAHELKKELEIIAADPNASENELDLAKELYRSLGNQQKADELDRQIKQRFPHGQPLKDAKPVYLTERQWKEQQLNAYYTEADTYATQLYHDKEYEKAYALEKEAVEFFKRKVLSMNETYCLLAEKVKGAKTAQKELELFIKDGNASANMKDQLKRIYLSQNHTQAQWNAYMAVVQKEHLQKIKEELVKKMLNDPAPHFTLKDLAGNEISLAKLKGKTVVVNFWATWCGSCLESLQGMQKMVNKYKADSSVVFLFIDTWESKRVVKEFISKNKYTLTVLYDEFSVVGDYKVESIPTKFVIDKNGNIRFKHTGFAGNADALAAELSLMIELAGSEAKAGPDTAQRRF